MMLAGAKNISRGLEESPIALVRFQKMLVCAKWRCQTAQTLSPILLTGDREALQYHSSMRPSFPREDISPFRLSIRCGVLCNLLQSCRGP